MLSGFRRILQERALYAHVAERAFAARAAAAAETTTQAGPAKLPMEPPMRLYDLPGRYATALWTSAEAGKQLDQVARDMGQLKSVTGPDSTLVPYLADPSNKKQEKTALLASCLEQIKASELTRQLVAVLGEYNRLKELPAVIARFEQLQGAAKGALEATVVVAKMPSAAEQKEIKKGLEAYQSSGADSIKVSWKVRPEIMGGLMVYIGDVFVDCSVSKNMRQVEELIAQNA